MQAASLACCLELGHCRTAVAIVRLDNLKNLDWPPSYALAFQPLKSVCGKQRREMWRVSVRSSIVLEGEHVMKHGVEWLACLPHCERVHKYFFF